MAPRPERLQRISVDTNVLLDLAAGLDDVVDGLEVVRRKLQRVEIVIPPTVIEEIAFQAQDEEDAALQRLASEAIQKLIPTWHFQPMALSPVERGMAEEFGKRLRRMRVLPDEEVNDALIIAESALCNSILLLSTDQHMASIDFQDLTRALKPCDVTPPVICRPADIAKKFFS
ncbi:MAG: type II toxin-antitoxin system VapC family toxin [Verrucomicrobia bacterium]|nr:type II toxin-antitoxin system VapC family toxin [Verrucomicrobiota bacterium]